MLMCISFVRGKRHANALDLADSTARAVRRLYRPGRGVTQIHQFVAAQGGYIPVPESACAADQIFLASVTMEADAWVFPMGLPMPDFTAAVEEWRRARAQGSPQSLRAFLIEKLPWLR